MNGETFHKILEPYLFAVAITVAILAATALALWRDGRRRREAETLRLLPPPDSRP